MNFSRRKGVLILCDIDKKIVLWNLSNDHREVMQSDAIVTAVAIHPKQDEIAANCWEHGWVWDKIANMGS